ncbi:excinuclease ATPase subunit [Piscinibacter gummiphilus]|uniref:Excinuclease ATPase subunit n=1 Tax=Piscinibacter gummiphilus TaxID=946333 RepID=A0A1W6L2V5_9BURK|nr:excinuclease ATPase subunit [Piscinibacter gummiphilus]ARN18611.1 excinuclease ATPase subunit [Piscinibacter gummiphilus]ATU63240.1 excinuclease ATPase subunit [Piscinibacter gummiphilus]GLS95575.1 phosphoribosylglycinamide formyltransferase [Piscinibacter gummiphilus]
MNKTLLIALLTAASAFPAFARDTELKLPLADVLAMPEAQEKLDGSVKFFLAGAPTPKVLEKKGEDVSNKKTNGVGKADEVACRWAALSALIAFQDKAKTLGANAVVDLVSYYKKNTFSSPTEYECHAGGMIVGVTLKGTYAKIPN